MFFKYFRLRTIHEGPYQSLELKAIKFSLKILQNGSQMFRLGPRVNDYLP